MALRAGLAPTATPSAPAIAGPGAAEDGRHEHRGSNRILLLRPQEDAAALHAADVLDIGRTTGNRHA
ncbi:MAG: hypothetical protein GX591_13585 [Planctomycetes bacterium]|nr:hypothetical protein [Planctomycetota bacterium]